MVPGDYPVETAKNAGFEERWSIAGISTTTGYSVKMQVRVAEDDTGSALLTLTSDPAAGLALSTSGGSLHVDVTITETQIDALYDALVAAGAESGWYSLKLTRPAGEPQQWLKGTFTVVPTPTA